MKRLLAFATAAGLAVGAFAQAPTSDGEVQKIDKAQGRITLRHGAIKSLDLPPMTMAYRVRDSHLLDAVTVGDTVRFAAAKVDGQYTVTAIVKAP